MYKVSAGVVASSVDCLDKFREMLATCLSNILIPYPQDAESQTPNRPVAGNPDGNKGQTPVCKQFSWKRIEDFSPGLMRSIVPPNLIARGSRYPHQRRQTRTMTTKAREQRVAEGRVHIRMRSK